MKIRFFLVFVSGLFIFSGCIEDNKSSISADKKLNLANSFFNNQLYDAAIKEYLDYLKHYDVDDNRRANTYYTIADIYFERKKDYSKALEYYFRVKYLYPGSSLQSEVGKKIVNCLERLERSQDAQRVLDKETALKPSEVKEYRAGEIVAQIGNKKMTQGDLDFEIQQLPPYIKDNLSGKDQKLEFLKQHILQELLYDSAKRQGLDQDQDVIDGAFRAKKSLMAQKILEQEIKKSVNIKPEDIELYYKANKDKYAEKDEDGNIKREKPFNEVAQQVAQDLSMERQQSAYNELMQRLMKAENVKIYEDRIK